VLPMTGKIYYEMSLFKNVKYQIILQNSIAHMMNALQSVRIGYDKDIDNAIKAVDLVQKHLPELKRALIYYKNTVLKGDNNDGPTPPPPPIL